MSKVFTITDGLENMGALRTGGQGSVYKGRRQGQIFTAVKLLPTPIATESLDDKNYRNFINEVEKLKKVNEVPNPNVVKILSSGVTESGSLPFIEMEFIEGPDLGELLTEPNDKIFTLREAIKVAEQLACALAHCHKVGVKHGDIKSNNVKLNVNSGNYVLLDFGLSVMTEEARRTSMRHAGAIEFMAPEQNEGEVLFQTDIYSYGVILYELLTGQVPFPLHDSGETSRNAVMVSHMESPVPDLVALRRQNLPANWTEEQKQHEALVPDWLVSLVNRCLEKVPEKRFGNGMDLHEAIVRSSVAARPDANTVYLLKSENETLKSELLQLQQVSAKDKAANISIPKKLFKIAAAVFALLFIFSVYSLFSGGSEPATPVAATAAQTAFVPFVLQNQYIPPKPKPVVANKPRPAAAAVEKAKPGKAKGKKKGRRKKFLGIF